MRYNVSINEAKRSITVTLSDGTKGVARCCPTDRFDINTGIELALERAKVAQKVANTPVKEPTIMELVKALEKALPKGQMVLVGNGKELTDNQKKWLASLAGVSAKCNCPCCDCDEGDYESGYDDGYEDGYADAMAEMEESDDMDATIIARILEILDVVGAI